MPKDKTEEPVVMIKKRYPDFYHVGDSVEMMKYNKYQKGIVHKGIIIEVFEEVELELKLGSPEYINLHQSVLILYENGKKEYVKMELTARGQRMWAPELE